MKRKWVEIARPRRVKYEDPREVVGRIAKKAGLTIR